MKLMKKNGATATDDRDGDLTSKIKTTGKVDTKKEGTYIITYTVEDSAKNSASVTRIVIVKGGGDVPTISTPQITLNGEREIRIKVGETFSDPGATATDSTDGNLTNKITKTGTVDTNTAGEYKITYTVKNSAGKEATVTRTVIVEE